MLCRLGLWIVDQTSSELEWSLNGLVVHLLVSRPPPPEISIIEAIFSAYALIFVVTSFISTEHSTELQGQDLYRGSSGEMPAIPLSTTGP